MWHGSRNFYRWFQSPWGLKAIMEIDVVFANNAYISFHILFFLSLENFIHTYDVFCPNLPPFPPLWFPSYPHPNLCALHLNPLSPFTVAYTCMHAGLREHGLRYLSRGCISKDNLLYPISHQLWLGLPIGVALAEHLLPIHAEIVLV